MSKKNFINISLLLCVIFLVQPVYAEPEGPIKMLMSSPASKFDVGMIRLHNWASLSAGMLREKYGATLTGYANYDAATNKITIGIDKHTGNSAIEQVECKEILLQFSSTLFGNLAFPSDDISKGGVAVIIGGLFSGQGENNSEAVGRALMPDMQLVATIGNLVVTTDMAKQIPGIKQIRCTTPIGYRSITFVVTSEK